MEKISHTMYARRLLGATTFCLLSFGQVNLAADELELNSPNPAVSEEVAVATTEQDEKAVTDQVGMTDVDMEPVEAAAATMATEEFEENLVAELGDKMEELTVLLNTVQKQQAKNAAQMEDAQMLDLAETPTETEPTAEMHDTTEDVVAKETTQQNDQELAQDELDERSDAPATVMESEPADQVAVLDRDKQMTRSMAAQVTPQQKVEEVAQDMLEEMTDSAASVVDSDPSDLIAVLGLDEDYLSDEVNNWKPDLSDSDKQIADLGEQVIELRAELERMKDEQLAMAEHRRKMVRDDDGHNDHHEAGHHHGHKHMHDAQHMEHSQPHRPSFEVHGTVRFDVATMCRTPQFGVVIQPGTVQVPLNKDLERRQGVTYFDARASNLEFVARHNICDMDIMGKVKFSFDPELDVSEGAGRFGKGFAVLSNAFVKIDYDHNTYALIGLARNLTTVSKIANPLKLHITDLQGPAGYVSSTQPQVKLATHRHLDDDMGEIHGFVGVEQQRMWRGLFSNGEIALRPSNGDALAIPLFAAGVSWENFKPLQIDLRAGVSQNRYAIEGTKDDASTAAWLAKASLESYLWGPSAYLSYTYFDGMGRVLRLAFPDAVLDGDDDIHNVKGHAFYGGMYFDVSDWFSCNMAAGWMRASDIEGTAFRGDVYNQYKTIQVGIWREFCEHYVLSGEYKRWFVKAINGDKGDLNLFMASVAFHF